MRRCEGSLEPSFKLSLEDYTDLPRTLGLTLKYDYCFDIEYLYLNKQYGFEKYLYLVPVGYSTVRLGWLREVLTQHLGFDKFLLVQEYSDTCYSVVESSRLILK